MRSGWWSTIRSLTPQGKAETAKREAAHNLGKRAAEAAMHAVDAFMVTRGKSVGDAIFGVFQGIIDRTPRSGPQSPIDMVRIDAKIFLEQVEEYRQRMFDECSKAVDGWLKSMELVGTADMLRQYIRSQIAEASVALVMRSVDLAADRIEELKKAGFTAVLTKDMDENRGASVSKS